MKFKIGDTLLDNNVFLAPMAGVTDLPFRLLCREQGAGMSVTDTSQGAAIVWAVGSSHVQLLCDVFHMQMMHGNLLIRQIRILMI